MGRRPEGELKTQRQHRPGRPGAAGALGAAGVLVIVAALGTIANEALLLGLLPAAGLLAFGFAAIGRMPGDRRLIFAAWAVSLAALALLALALTGIGWDQRVGVEPNWLASATNAAGWFFAGSAAAFGWAARGAGFLRLRIALLLALSLPLGLIWDTALERVPGIFLHGIGFYAGLSAFGLALVGLSRSAEMTPKAPAPG